MMWGGENEKYKDGRNYDIGRCDIMTNKNTGRNNEATAGISVIGRKLTVSVKCYTKIKG